MGESRPQTAMIAKIAESEDDTLLIFSVLPCLRGEIEL
jgi:hypothetical protein